MEEFGGGDVNKKEARRGPFLPRDCCVHSKPHLLYLVKLVHTYKLVFTSFLLYFSLKLMLLLL